MSEYVPERWVVLKMNSKYGIVNKVFAGWSGGYLDGDSWKLNSGNVKEEEFDDRWEFTGYSGSVYICYKRNYGMTGYMTSLLQGWQSVLPETASLEILDNYNVHVAE